MKNNFLIFLIIVLLVSCKNLQLNGQLKGNDRGFYNEFNISSKLNDSFCLKSKVAKPYEFDNLKLPIYTENSIEIIFW